MIMLLKAQARIPHEAIVLDRMLPGGVDGLTVLSTLRTVGVEAPVLILSALSAVNDGALFRAGGDDHPTNALRISRGQSRGLRLWWAALQAILGGTRRSAPVTWRPTSELGEVLRWPAWPSCCRESTTLLEYLDAATAPGRDAHDAVRRGLGLSLRRTDERDRRAHWQSPPEARRRWPPTLIQAPCAALGISSVRLSDLRHTTSFCHGPAVSRALRGGSRTLFGFLYWQTAGYLKSGTDEWLARELASLVAASPSQLIEHLNEHAARDPEGDRPFALFDAAGHGLAGNVANLPTPSASDRPFEFSLNRGGEAVPFRGLAHRLPSGDIVLVSQNVHEMHEFRELLVGAMAWGGLLVLIMGLAGAAVIGVGSVRRIDRSPVPSNASSMAIWPSACRPAGRQVISTGWWMPSMECWTTLSG